MEKQLIQALIKKCALGLFDLACAVSGKSSWDLSLPIGVIDARRDAPKLVVTSVGTINSTLRASATIGHPLMLQFFARFEDVGVEEALTEMKQGAQADAFKEVCREERRNGEAPMWSVEDATAFVLKSKEAHADREVACVAILPGEPHRIVTFSVPIAFLTNPSE
jgi:hypothetical protein